MSNGAQWYVFLNSQESGPYSESELQTMLDERKINLETHVFSKDILKRWIPLKECIKKTSLIKKE